MALLEILAALTPGVGDVREAEHRDARGAREGIERGGLHLDREHTLGAGALDGFGGLPKRRIRRPARADDGIESLLGERRARHRDQARIGFRELSRCGVVIARAFIAQRALDDHEIGRRSGRNDLARRCQAENQAAPAGEQLLLHQHVEGRSHRAADDPRDLLAERQGVELRVIAGPSRERMRLPGATRAADDVAVGVEDADRRNVDGGEPLLPPRLAQQRLRCEHRRRARKLVGEDGRLAHAAFLATIRTPWKGHARRSRHSDAAASRRQLAGGRAGAWAAHRAQPPCVLAAAAARYAAGEIGRESMIRVKSPQDFWAGVLCGCAAIWIGRNYAFGTLTRMGPGYLPAVLSWALVAIGGVLMVRALAHDGPAIEPSRITPQLFILAAIVVFALTIERLGLALAVALVALTAAFASRDMRWVEAIALALGLAALCVLLFVHLLGQPFTVWAF